MQSNQGVSPCASNAQVQPRFCRSAAQLVEDRHRRWMHGVAAEVAQEVPALFDDGDVDTRASQQIAAHHPTGPPPAMTTSAERPGASVIGGRGCEISERILFYIRLIDRDPAGPGEAMRRSGNPFQAAVAWQAKIETGSNLLPLNKHERHLGLRLPGDQRVP